MPDASKLNESIEADICIVGAGIAGLTTGCMLTQAGQYLDWLTPGEVGSVREIEPECGAVLRRGMRKIAAYRDADGKVHEISAVCPHLGCIVHWNNAEHTWDCPCHGSRFDAEGKVLNGPSNVDLEKAE